MKFVFGVMALAVMGGAGPALAWADIDVTLDHGAVWQTGRVGETTQGFLDVHNTGDRADRLVGWSCPIAGVTALVGADGGALPGLVIPAGQTVRLEVAGPHLVLAGTRETVEPGSVVPCAFTFQEAGDIGGYLNAVAAPSRN